MIHGFENPCLLFGLHKNGLPKVTCGLVCRQRNCNMGVIVRIDTIASKIAGQEPKLSIHETIGKCMLARFVIINGLITDRLDP
jgi:hypothetical protein